MNKHDILSNRELVSMLSATVNSHRNYSQAAFDFIRFKTRNISGVIRGVTLNWKSDDVLVCLPSKKFALPINSVFFGVIK